MTASTAGASATSPSCTVSCSSAKPSRGSDGWRSPCTSCRSASARTSQRPTKPPAPVTKTRTSALQALQIGAYHQLDELRKAHPRRPAEHAPRLCRVADQRVHLGGTDERRVGLHVILPAEPHHRERDIHEL